MAAIQALRNKSKLLTIVIGLALLAFIVTGLDRNMFSSQKNQDVVASINNVKYPYHTYQEFQEIAEANSQNIKSLVQEEQIYQSAWNQFVLSMLHNEQFSNIGLGIKAANGELKLSNDEFKDITTGNNIDPELQASFRNPNTGIFDKEMLINTLASLGQHREENPEFYENWLYFEKYLHKKKIEEKYKTLIENAVNVNSLEAENAIRERSQTVDIEFVRIPYELISTDDITISDAEIKAHYNKIISQSKYDQDKSVTIEYVSFDLIPTAQDIESTKQSVASKAEAFKEAKNNAVFLNLNSDVKFANQYFRKGELSSDIDSFAFGGKINDITELYLDGNSYKIAKISDIRLSADSAKVRHILLTDSDAYTKADSIKGLLEKGANFNELALKYSADSGSARLGGVIDWFTKGQMVQAFQDSSFVGVKGTFYIVPTEYGVHIIDILAQSPKTKEVQVQYLSKEITYSSSTRKNIYKDARQFASENRTYKQFEESIAANPNITKRLAEKVKENERNLPGIFESRQIIRWAYTNKNTSEVSDVFSCNDKLIVAVVKEKHEEGKVPLADIEEDIKHELKKQKQRELTLAKVEKSFNPQDSLSKIAEEFYSQAVLSHGINFSSFSAPSIGVEPKVIASASYMKETDKAKIISGDNGLYVIRVVKAESSSNTEDVARERKSTTERTKYSYIQAYQQVVKDKAVIKDYRINFM